MSLFINRQQYALTDSKFKAEKSKKDLIVLHYSAGSTAFSAFQSWKARTDRVSSAFVIEKNGMIFQCFDPSFWAFHLGLKTPHWESGRHDKRSIGIEIASEGPLIRKGEFLYWWPNKYNVKYCHVEEKEKYICADWRGMQYHSVITEEQIKSTVSLVQELCAQFNIPPDLSIKKMEYDIEFFKKWTGISCHHNFRSDKFDTGPAFPLDRLKF